MKHLMALQAPSSTQAYRETEDFIMGEEAQVIFDEFFAKLESALAAQAA